MPFTATQHVAVERTAFSWRARFRLAGPLAIGVVDGFSDGRGSLEVRILGVRAQRQEGPEIDAGEALRYLAELPWAPHALRGNRELEWAQVDERAVEVAAVVAGRRLAARMEFDAAGDIVRTSSQQRLLRVGKRWEPTPWAGEFRDYAVLGGVRVPTRAEVYWDSPAGRFVYWRGTITSLELLDEEAEGGGARPGLRRPNAF